MITTKLLSNDLSKSWDFSSKNRDPEVLSLTLLFLTTLTEDRDCNGLGDLFSEKKKVQSQKGIHFSLS